MHTVLLLMAEHALDDAPLWYRGEDDRIGPARYADLGLSVELRRDLVAWNEALWELVEPRHGQQLVRTEAAHRVDAFALAARVQGELGDEVHVWCGGGSVVLSATGSGADLDTGGRPSATSAHRLGARASTSEAIVRWRTVTGRASTDGPGAPFGNAETRALGLRTAGRVQADLGGYADVAFYAGMPATYELSGVRSRPDGR